MSKSIAELRNELKAKREQLASIIDEAGSDRDFTKITSITGSTSEKVAEVRRRNAEINDLAADISAREEAEGIAATNRKELDALTKPVDRLTTPGTNGQREQVKSWREIIAESKEYSAFRAGQSKTARMFIPAETYDREFKTLLTLTTINNLATRAPGIQTSAQETATVADLMLQGTTDNNALSYYVETTFTNAAVEVAEGGTKPESALAFTERTDNVRKIATWIPATDELLADVSGFESYVRGRLGFMIERREETELLTGDGIAPNIQGIVNRTGIQTQAKGADPTPDAIFKGIVKVQSVAFADPTAIVMHPNDWQDVRLLRTADGIYIWGSPSEMGTPRMWGLPVRVTTAMTENTALVGAFRPYAQIFRRSGVEITVSTEHSTYFVENKVAILAEERLALAVYRPAAFCTVTGI